MKKNTALYILGTLICLIIAAFIFNIPLIKNISLSTFGMMKSIYVIGSAAICAFIFINNKNYWLIIAGVSIIISLMIQYGVTGHGAGIYTITTRALAFVVVVYLLNLVRVIFNK